MAGSDVRKPTDRRRRHLARHPERARAYIAAAQRDLNVHLRRLGSPSVLAVDGEWDADTQLAFERVCRILGDRRGPDVRTFRLIGASVADRTDAEKAARRRRTEPPSSSSSGRSSPRRQRRRAAPDAPHATADRRRWPLAGQADARARAYVAALQRDLNRHLIALGSPTVLAVDGTLGPRHRRRVPARLPRARHRGPAQRAHLPRRSPARPRRSATPSASERAKPTAPTYAAEAAPPLRARPVPEPPKPKPPSPSPRSRTAPTSSRPRCAPPAPATRTRSSASRARHGVPVSLVCAVLEVETGFQNVFGHDASATPSRARRAA